MNKQQNTTIAIKMDNLYQTYIEYNAIKNNIKLINNIEPLLTIESDIIYSDEYIYKKPWNKLNNIHKIIKLKEFINTLHFDDIEMKKTLQIKLINMIKDKTLTKNADINYDSVNGSIVAIPMLQYINNKYII